MVFLSFEVPVNCLKRFRSNHSFYRLFLAKLQLVSLALLPLLFHSAFAAPPIPFDSWSNRGGTITANCPGGYTCADNVTSDNMIQRILTNNATGENFIQLVIQNGTVGNGGQMNYEAFTSANDNALSGISAKAHIRQTGEFNIDYTTELNLGWANSPANSAIELSHRVNDTYQQGVTMAQTFDYSQNQNNNGSATGYFYGIRQDVRNSAVLNGSGSGDSWSFVLRRAGGDFVRAGSASLGAAAGNGMGGMGGAGGGMGGAGGGGGMGAAVAPAPAPAPTPTPGAAAPAPIPIPTPIAPTPAPGGGVMGRALSAGNSNGTTISARSVSARTFEMPAIPYGIGTIDNGPPEDTVFGPIDNVPPFVGNLPGGGNSDTGNSTVGANNNNDRNFTGSGGIVSFGNAGGANIPPGRIDVPTGSTAGMGGGSPLAGGTVSWNTGNEVQVIWIGQSCSSCVLAGMGGMGGGSGNYSFQQYENISTGAISTSQSILGTAPLNWLSTPFGPAP